MEGQTRRETGYFWSKHTYVDNTRSFSKTHLLKLALKRADKERNRLLLIKHTRMHNTRPFSKTHSLMTAMEGADKERNRLLAVKHTHIQTQDHSV